MKCITVFNNKGGVGRTSLVPVADLDVPRGEMMPIGYVVMQHAVRLNRPVKAYEGVRALDGADPGRIR